jgi:chemotaxis methyl-accepting protein methylase
VGRQVCRQLRRRLDALAVTDLDAYRARLEASPEERVVRDALTPITISGFYRVHGLRAAGAHGARALDAAAVAARRQRLAARCAGCASGEEAYMLTLMWHEAVAQRLADLRPRS